MACHLTEGDRVILDRLKQKGESQKRIAEVLEVAPSTICRELKRNSTRDGYCPQRAQGLADSRGRKVRRVQKLANPELRRYVEDRLELLWSPDQIAGRARLDYPQHPDRRLSHQTIYNWINRHAPDWKQYLRRQGQPPQTRGKRHDVVRIDGRPDIINRRQRYGDWEGDTLVGKGRHSALITLVERRSGYVRLGRADNMTAELTARVIKRRMRELPSYWLLSITFDNGKEFMDFETIASALDLDIYFAMPYRSWQRGTSENTNGLIRQFYPKGTDFTQTSHQGVARAETLLNERPRKRLGYQTPAEVFAKHSNCF